MPYKSKKKQERVKKRIIKNVKANKTKKATKQYEKYRKKIDSTPNKPKEKVKKNKDVMGENKKPNKNTGLFKKESSAQEKANLMTQDPVDNRAATMKKGKAYAKKTGSYKSAEMHYMENELNNKKTGHDVAASYDKKKLGSILSKHMSRNK